MKTIEQLQKIMNDTTRSEQERREAAEHILKLGGQQTEIDVEANQIEDDDPEVLSMIKPDEDPEMEALFCKFLPRTVPQAKQKIAEQRRHNRLRAVAGDESKPMSERIEAAEQWRADAPLGSHWLQYSEADLVERLTPHPHRDRLKELALTIKDESATVKARFAAIDEHRRLWNEFPKREIPQAAYVLHHEGYDDMPGRDLADKVAKIVEAKTGRVRWLVAQEVRANRGRDYGVPIADISCYVPKTSHPEARQAHRQLTTEEINRWFDHRLAQLGTN